MKQFSPIQIKVQSFIPNLECKAGYEEFFAYLRSNYFTVIEENKKAVISDMVYRIEQGFQMFKPVMYQHEIKAVDWKIFVRISYGFSRDYTDFEIDMEPTMMEKVDAALLTAKVEVYQLINDLCALERLKDRRAIGITAHITEEGINKYRARMTIRN